MTIMYPCWHCNGGPAGAGLCSHDVEFTSPKQLAEHQRLPFNGKRLDDGWFVCDKCVEKIPPQRLYRHHADCIGRCGNYQ